MDIQVVLLCAGRSSRMWPLSDKIFFEYLGKSVVEHQIEMILGEPSVTNIHIVGNSENLPKLISLVQEKFSEKSSHFTFSEQKNLDEGMLGGVLSAEGDISLQKPLLVISSNDFVEKSFLRKLIDQANNSDSSIFLCGKEVQRYFPGGYLVLDSGKLVRKIWEKPGEGNEPSNFINLVFHLFTSPGKLFEFLKKSKVTAPGASGYEESLQNLFDAGEKAEMVGYNGFWQALKYPWHHLKLMEYFLGQIEGVQVDPSALIASNTSLSGNVFIGKGVKIFDFAVISGPAYIGENCILGNHSLVRGSHIGPGCVIGHTTEIARSYLRKDIWTHQNYIGDSILDENISFGAGSRTANFRLDEQEISIPIQGEKIRTETNKLGLVCGKDVRSGINTSFFPGVKIGSNSLLGAGISVTEDIQENQFVLGESILKKKENKIPVQKRKVF